MSTNTKENPSERDGLALIIGGLFIVALVFAAYNYFNKSSEEISKTQKEVVFQDESASDRIEGDVNGEAAADKNLPPTVAGTISNGSANRIIKAEWVATDYKEGDIQGASYTVKSGDTLWEIAEGTYGDGTQWTKILEANKSDVGFLVSGQQALIIPGQVLVLP